MRKEIEMLEHHSRSSFELYLSGSYAVETVDASQQRALSGTRRSDDRHDLTLVHRKVHVVDCLEA